MQTGQNVVNNKQGVFRKKQLGLLKKLHKICECHQISYFLNGGTLLGAVRHQGFIPWDDDVDIAMMREDYERFCRVVKKYESPTFQLQKPQRLKNYYLWGFARIRDATTTQATILELHQGPSHVNYGIWLDIQILDNAYPKGFRRILYSERVRFWQCMRLAKTFFRHSEKVFLMSDQAWRFFKKASRVLSCHRIDQKLDDLVIRKNKKAYVASFAFHRSRHQTCYFKASWFESSVIGRFEGMVVNLPKDYDQVLRTHYGKDYMRLPKPEDRQSGHGNLLIDPYVSYKKYRKMFARHAWKKGYKKNNAQEKIILFGSGQQASFYLLNEGKDYQPSYIVDNDSNKWGENLCGIEIKNPQVLRQEVKGTYRIIIANIYWEEISRQLDEWGIEPYYSYVNSQIL